MKRNKPDRQLPFSNLGVAQDTTDAGFARRLLQIKDSDELEELLKEQLGTKIFISQRYWRAVGDQLSNAGPIEASPDEINPLIERIVNGMEAVTELRIEEERRKRVDWKTPNSPSKAIEVVFGIADGATERMDPETARTKFGDYVQLRLRGRKETPTIVIRDKGTGIHPSEFSKTIVSLGQSSKGQKEYLIGMYGQGGSSAFEKSEYSVIFSRKHPSLLSKDDEDTAGWTIVRKRLSVRTHVYEYLFNPETKQVFTVPGIVCDEAGFGNGTHVSHVSYKNLGPFAMQKITNYAYYTLNFRLFNPLIPWTLIDEREAATERRTMRGVPYRINQLPRSTTSVLPPQQAEGESASVRHYAKYLYQDPSYGSILVEWWVLQSEEMTNGRREHRNKVVPYRDPSRRYVQRRVAVTRGGQVHAALPPTIFATEGLNFIANSIIVHVNTDQLSYQAGASFFASNRSDLKRESEEIIEKAIRAAIYQFRSELMGIQREREREIVGGRGAKDEDVLKQKLDPMIKAFLRSISGGGGDATRRKRADTPRFRGKAIPTTLEFARANPLEVVPGVPTHLELVTDASDSVMTSRKTALRFIQSVSPGIAELTVAGGGDGRWRVRLVPYPEISAGAKCDLSADMEQSTWRVETKKPCRLVVIPPPEEYKGNNPPTYMRFRTRAKNEVHIQQGGGRVSIDTNCTDNLFDYAKFAVSCPNGTLLSGYGYPSKGQIRLTIGTGADINLGEVGKIEAKLELSDGSALSAGANLVIVKKQAIESSNEQYVPNYNIHYVREVPANEEDKRWDDMQGILDCDSPWNSEDVGGTYVASEDGKLHIYLNVDNKEMLAAESKMVKRNTESTIEAFRQNHRALIIYHLYLLGISDGSGRLITVPGSEEVAKGSRMKYSDYRNEMIRLNRTALYATREYLDAIKEIEGTDN